LDASGKNHNLVTLTVEVASEKASDLPATSRQNDSPDGTHGATPNAGRSSSP
jgi:hypothetical protein